MKIFEAWKVTPSRLYLYGAIPLAAVIMMLPSLNPVQLTFVCVNVAVGVVVGVTITGIETAEHP
ncbi:hypothetical protein D3C85_1125860 [compost metagenome]